MSSVYKRISLLCIVLSMLVAVCGCASDEYEVTVIEESYDYSTKSKYYLCPAVVDGWAEKDALTTENGDGTFFCFTADTAQADDFINAQRTLLHFLRDHGVEIGEMEYYGTDYEFCFSESRENAAYTAFSHVRTWQQVLVTLQAIWGDYTDYGYVYAMANAIAAELGWATDPVQTVEKVSMDTFFSENPAAINLLYPTFTTEFASEETVDSCKALSALLFEEIDWRDALTKTIEEQLDDYYALLSDYAQEISVPFTRQSCGYAYYGENVKLRIMTTYAELIIDNNYQDTMASLYGDYWNAYSSIYVTANTINEEITAAVEYFGLEDAAGIMEIRWLDSEDSLTKKFVTGSNGTYYSSTHIAYVTSIRPYLHEYYHHIEYLITDGNNPIWQSQAFCEIGASYSRYAQLTAENTFAKSEQGVDLFYAITGRSYQSGRNDYFETWDILCYINNYYSLAYRTGAQSINSFSRYLIDLYGEDAVYNLMLFPETIENVTGKTWDKLQEEWEQYIKEKYSDVTLPDWLSQ